MPKVGSRGGAVHVCLHTASSEALLEVGQRAAPCLELHTASPEALGGSKGGAVQCTQPALRLSNAAEKQRHDAHLVAVLRGSEFQHDLAREYGEAGGANAWLGVRVIGSSSHGCSAGGGLVGTSCWGVANNG